MRPLLLVAALAALALPAAAQTGMLDPTFGTNGRVAFDPSGTLQSGATDAAILPDGRVLLSGRIGTDAAVVRLTATGALDPTFGAGGIVRVALGGVQGVFASVVVLPDGTIVAAGGSQDASSVGNGAALVRISPAGVVGGSFGTGGVVREDTQDAGSFASLALQPDGRLVAIGQFVDGTGNSRFVAARYLADGTRDASFGTGGLASPDGITNVPILSGSALALDAQGRLVGTGFTFVPGTILDSEIRTFRLTAAGVLDASFGNGGVAVAPLGPGSNTALALAIDASGNAVVGGNAADFATGTADLVLLRYTPDGALDGSFGSAGVVRVNAFGLASVAFDLALQNDGRILVGGSAGPGDSGDFLLARFTHAGALDAAFGTGGRTTVDFGSSDIALALALGADGRAVLAGVTGDAEATQTSFAVARFTTDGRPLPTDEAPPAATVALSAAPNPFAGASTLRLALGEAQTVRVDVTDALGRTVAVLHDGALGPGEHTFRLDGSRLAPGVYVVRATGGASVRVVRR